ncbi:adenine phosphoribosyltransferase [bacterium]|nr:adenine phosphoribosyltransferase [bacterium]
MEKIKEKVRDILNFPKPGIVFKDITPLLGDPRQFHKAVDMIADHYSGKRVDQIVCVEARGFILGAPLAYKLGTGIVPVRKPGKLPGQTLQTTYALEYGTDSLEVHADAIKPGERVLIADDLLATGGTVAAAMDLIGKLKGEIVGITFLIELAFLKGREKLGNQDVFSLLTY